MNLLFLAHSSQRGGAEFCLDTTLKCLNRAQIEPFVIFPSDGPMAESAKRLGIHVEFLPWSWWMLYEPSLWEWKNRLGIPGRQIFLSRFIRDHHIDAVYTNTVCLFEGALAARRAGIPHVTHIHEVLLDEFMRPRWFSLPKIVRFFYRNSQSVIFESDPARKIAEELLISAVKKPEAEKLLQKSAVVSNSSRLTLEEVKSFGPTQAEPTWRELAQYGVEPGRWTALWLGRFSERKNPFLLLQAVERLPENVRGAIQIIFAGAGPLEESLRVEFQAKNLGNVCRIVPFQTDIRPLLRLAKTLVLTSHEESFGLVLIEAGMFALPTIAVRSQGPCEIIQDGETGFLVPDEEPAILAQKILALFQSSELCETLGFKNQKRVMEFYDPWKNTAKIENELKKIGLN